MYFSEIIIGYNRKLNFKLRLYADERVQGFNIFAIPLTYKG